MSEYAPRCEHERTQSRPGFDSTGLPGRWRPEAGSCIFDFGNLGLAGVLFHGVVSAGRRDPAVGAGAGPEHRAGRIFSRRGRSYPVGDPSGPPAAMAGGRLRGEEGTENCSSLGARFLRLAVGGRLPAERSGFFRAGRTARTRGKGRAARRAWKIKTFRISRSSTGRRPLGGKFSLRPDFEPITGGTW